MKTLNEFVSNRYISLKELSEEQLVKLKNLDNYMITECCCCRCYEPVKYDCGECYEDPAFTKYFYSEQEVINKLKASPKVQDIYNLKNQFENNKFHMIPTDTPLIFIERLNLPSGEIMIGKYYHGNKSLIKLLQKTELTDNTILVRLDNSIQVFGLLHTGTNGKEMSIKNSLIKTADKLTLLESFKEITWAQVLDVVIDNLDDSYTFLITYTIDINTIQDNN